MHAFILFRQQLGQRLKGLLCWVVVWGLLSLLFASVFDALMGDGAPIATFQQLPSGVLDAVNIDPDQYLSRPESFLSGQFLFIYLLAGSIFALSLGVGAIGRRIRDRTIANLLTRPLARGRLYSALLGANLITLLMAGMLVGGLQYLAFDTSANQADVSLRYLVGLHAASTVVFMLMAALGQLLGTLLNGTLALPLGAGLAVISWFVNTLGGLAGLPDWLQKTSVYYYFDVERLRDQFSLDMGRTIVLLGLLIMLSVVGTLYFKRKNIYL